MRKEILELLYDRYNEFNNFKYTVQNPYTMIRILCEGDAVERIIEMKIKEYEIDKHIQNKFENYQSLVSEKNFVQPKSLMLRLHYLNLIVTALPECFYVDLGITSDSIKQISVAITLYYFGLQTYKFSDVQITDTERKNIIGREDFYVGIRDLQMVCAKITEQDFRKYLELFAVEIDEVSESDNTRLYLNKGQAFILCIEEFLDYMLYKTENNFKEQYTEQKYSEYSHVKGLAFEKMVYGILKEYFMDVHHSMYYYPNERQEIEVDVVVKQDDNIAIFECKSGTIDVRDINKDDVLKVKIKNKVKKAYKSLEAVSYYIIKSKEYRFSNNKDLIVGVNNDPMCIHISMYSLDFMASNVHTIFPEYIENRTNPILTVSFEHLFAMLLDTRINHKNIFDYWKQRKEDISKYPGIQFDNNELDLYYELINSNKKTMLSELKAQGWIDNISEHGRVISSFHDEFGNEKRPASNMLMVLDSYLLVGLFSSGKQWFGINKRYLRNLEDFITVREND